MKKINTRNALELKLGGDYLFAAKMVNYTVVRNVFPMHAMMACGEREF